MQTQQTSSDEKNPQRQDVPRFTVAVMLGALALLFLTIGITYTVKRQSENQVSDGSSHVKTAAEAYPAPRLPTNSPTQLPPVEAAAPALPVPDSPLPEPTPTAQPSGDPLPTVTPTPELPPAPPREFEISGSTTMRLALSGDGFDSTGRPLSFQIEPRKAVVGGEVETAVDSWCIQLGLVNEMYDLSAHIDRETEDLILVGTISLHAGFCEQPGEVMDEVDVDLSVPTGASAQISYNLRGRSSLLGLEGLLDSDTGTIVELRVTNAVPE